MIGMSLSFFRFRHKFHSTRLVTIVQSRFRCILHHYNRLHLCLCRFCHRPHLTQLVKTVQFHFWHKTFLYDRSHHCLVLFSSQIESCPIGHDCSISSTNPKFTVDHNFAYVIFIIDHILLDQSRQFNFVFSIECTCVISHVVLYHFCHHYTRFDQSQQFCFVFGVDYTCTIGHVVVLCCFRLKLHLVPSIMIVQFHSRCRPHLYDWSSLIRAQLVSQLIRVQLVLLD